MILSKRNNDKKKEEMKNITREKEIGEGRQETGLVHTKMMKNLIGQTEMEEDDAILELTQRESIMERCIEEECEREGRNAKRRKAEQEDNTQIEKEKGQDNNILLQKDKMQKIEGKWLREGMYNTKDNPNKRYVDLLERYADNSIGEFKVKIELGYKDITGNKEKNKIKLMVLLNRNNIKPKKIFADSIYKMTLIFDESNKAKICIDKVNKGEVCDTKASIISIKNKVRKGVISDWDRNVLLEELVEAIHDENNNLISVERIIKKTRGDGDTVKWVKCDSIILTFNGDNLPNNVQLYGGACSMRMRPFIGNVLQCFRCYRYGHLAKYCKRQRICIVCGEEWHGICNKAEACVNCGKNHRANNRKCDYYTVNKEIKKVMAFDNCDFAQAKEKVSKLRSNAWKNKKEWSLINEATINKQKREIGHTSTVSETGYKVNDKNNNVEQNLREIIKKNNKGKTVELINTKIGEEQQPAQISETKEYNKEKKDKIKVKVEKELDTEEIQINIEPNKECNKENDPVTTNINQKEKKTTNCPIYKGPLKEIKMSTRILLWNCRGIKGKIQELESIAKDYDILVLTEVKVNINERIKIQSFDIYINCRESQNTGGGIIIAVRKNIKHEKIILQKNRIIKNNIEKKSINKKNSPNITNQIMKDNKTKNTNLKKTGKEKKRKRRK